MTSHAAPPEGQAGRSKSLRLTHIVIAMFLLAAAVAAILTFGPSSKGVPAAIASRRAKAVPRWAPATAAARQTGAIASDDEVRRTVLGVWEDDYEGSRTLTVRPDGTATMVVEFDGWKARLFTPRLQIETTWSIESGQFNRQTIGGEPADKVEFVKNRVGDRASDKIVKVTADRMLLIDQDGETRYDWRRVR